MTHRIFLYCLMLIVFLCPQTGHAEETSTEHHTAYLELVDVALTAEQKAEAAQVYAYCTSTPVLKNRHKCDCYTARFIDVRLEMGADAEQYLIYEKIGYSCPNVEQQVKIQHRECMSTAALLGTNGKSVKEYCECFADKWKEQFVEHGRVASSQTSKGFSSQAHSLCR